MTRTTGWAGEEQAAEAPAMPLTGRLLANRERRAGALETALARSAADDRRADREAAEQALDPDEYAANLIGRGYLPGMVSQLSMQLADTVAELADEEAKIEKAARRAEHLHRVHEAGRISALDVVRAMAGGDEGDEGRVRMLQRRAKSLRCRIGEANEAMSPPERREPDGVEAAASRARAMLAEVTRGQAAVTREAPPFGSASRFAGRNTEHTGPDCWVCREGGRRAAGGDLAAYAPGSVITTEWEDERVMRGADAGAGMAVRTVPDAVVGVS